MAIARDQEARQYVLRTAKENDVKFIRLWFTDILGTLKGFAITEAELEGALEFGMTFDGSTVQGFARRDESDMVAMPDPTTFSILPWRPRQNAVARMFCDVLRPSGNRSRGPPPRPEGCAGARGAAGLRVPGRPGDGTLLPEVRRGAGTAGRGGATST